MKKILLTGISIIAISVNGIVSSAYNEISCSTDPVFAENSCAQCFDGGVKAEGDQLGLLTDVWKNETSKSMYMLKAENELTNAVKMIPLNGASWSYEPTQEGFWEYTANLENLPNDAGFYKLDSGKSVDWIQSRLGYSIKLNKAAGEGQNAGLLKYVINVHLDEDGLPAEATNSHAECVLFKSSTTKTTTSVNPEKPRELPETGPQEVLLLLLSLLLAGGLFFISKRKA